MIRRRRRHRHRPRALHIARLIPNMITILALCAGLSSIKFALAEKWETAVIFILIAAFLDGIDGRLARMLKVTSPFGAELDSLADFFNFGVAPPLVIYLWHTQDVKGLGWAVVLFFAICAAIRLARFNTNLGASDKQPWMERFFTGVPSPAGAVLCLVPLMVDFYLQEPFVQDLPPALLSIYMAIVAFLMASRIPTFSMKKITIKPEFVSLLLLLGSLITITLIIEPWLTIPVLAACYLATLPFSYIYYRRLVKRQAVSE